MEPPAMDAPACFSDLPLDVVERIAARHLDRVGDVLALAST